MKLNKAEKAAAVIAALFILAAAAVWLRSALGSGAAITTERAASQSAELIGADAGGSDELAPGEKVDINTAPASELEKLAGIGAALAGRIVEYRQQHGAFSSPEDIMNVPGIGQAKFDAVKGSITT